MLYKPGYMVRQGVPSPSRLPRGREQQVDGCLKTGSCLSSMHLLRQTPARSKLREDTSASPSCILLGATFLRQLEPRQVSVIKHGYQVFIGKTSYDFLPNLGDKGMDLRNTDSNNKLIEALSHLCSMHILSATK